MNLEICKHQCGCCGRSYDSVESNSYDTYYVQLCRQCLEVKIFDLENKLNKLYDFFTTTSNLRVK